MELQKIKTFIIKPVPSFSYQGRHLHTITYTGGAGGIETKPLNKTKVVDAKSGKSCTDNYGFNRLDTNRNVYDTGLGEHTPNPYFLPKEAQDNVEEAVNALMTEKNLSSSWKSRLATVLKSQTIPYQVLYEINFSLEVDSLNSKVSDKRIMSLPHVIDPSAEKSIVAATRLVLYDESNVFRTDTLRGCLVWHLAQKHPYVANSIEEVNPGVHRWYVAFENDEFKETQKSNRLENKAIAKLVDLQDKYPVTNNLEDNMLYFIASLCDFKGKPIVEGVVKSFYIDDKLNEYVKPKDKSLVEYNTSRFLNVVEKFENNVNLFYAEYLVQQADNLNLVQRNNGLVYWLSQKLKNSEWYTFTSMEKLTQFIYSEMLKEDSPAYTEFVNELIKTKLSFQQP